jgi:hypothetical protein
METLLFVAERGEERFEVVADGGEGVYVLRYFGGQSTHDYLQNDIPMAYGCAEDEWGVMPADWRPALPGETPLWKKRA